MGELGIERYNQLLKRMRSKPNRASGLHKEAQVTSFNASLGKRRRVLAAEHPEAVDVTYQLGGGVLFHIMTNKNEALEAVHAEIRARNIPFSERNEQSMTIAEKRNLLRKNEMGVWAQERKAEAGIKLSDVTYLTKPITEPMKDLLERQPEILDKMEGRTDDGEAD